MVCPSASATALSVVIAFTVVRLHGYLGCQDVLLPPLLKSVETMRVTDLLQQQPQIQMDIHDRKPVITYTYANHVMDPSQELSLPLIFYVLCGGYPWLLFAPWCWCFVHAGVH